MQALASHRLVFGSRSLAPQHAKTTCRRQHPGAVGRRQTKHIHTTQHSLRNRRVVSCSNSSSDAGPPAGDEGSAPNDPSTPSTSYALPWETEQPAPPPSYASIKANIGHMDSNQLQTALGVAIATEDYQLATQIKERLHVKLVESGSAVISRPMDWRALGVPDWLADRAERLGFLFPTEVQRRAAPVILSGADCVITSQTGSGKTASFLMPALSKLDYPPELFPEDLEGPQLLLLVPSFELGVQACMLLYKLWGGNISSRTPGDPANMFTYNGPAGIKVRGVLNDEEVQMAVAGRYLRGVHALVATPDMALALLTLPNSPLSFQDLRAVVVDEVDALLDAYPASFGQLLDAAVHRHVPPGFEQDAAGQGLTAVGLDIDGPPGTSSPPAGSTSDSSSGSGADGQGKAEGPGGQDNLARLKALLSDQQQRKSPKQAGTPAGAGSPAAVGSSGGSSASLAAAAARLEGLLAAPAAAPVGEEAPAQQDAGSSTQQQQGAGSSTQQQQGAANSQQEAAAAAGGDSTQAAAAAAAAELAAQIPPEYDDPMPKPQVVLVGATVSEEDMRLALTRGWVTEPVVVRVGEEGSVPAGLKHRAIVVAQQQQRLGGLVASLRKDLSGALAAADAAAAAAGSGSSGSSDGTPPPPQQPVRVIIFARSEQEARTAAEPLRAALWGDHMLSVLLPSTGAEPVKAITAFRDRVASLLLATPSAARGLDLPAVSHVYSIGLPQDATEYVHRAGRAGRIGSTAGGEVVTVVTREELPLLQQMVQEELGLHVDVLELDKAPTGGLGLLGTDWSAAREGLLASGEEEGQAGEAGEGGAPPPPPQSEEKLEAARKGLEDLFNLL